MCHDVSYIAAWLSESIFFREENLRDRDGVYIPKNKIWVHFQMDHRNAMEPNSYGPTRTVMKLKSQWTSFFKIQEKLLLTGQIKNPNTIDANLTTENNDNGWMNEALFCWETPASQRKSQLAKYSLCFFLIVSVHFLHVSNYVNFCSSRIIFMQKLHIFL